MLRIMKLMIVIMATFLMQVSAAGFAQKVTYAQNNVSFKQLFSEIRKQTGYNVIWPSGKFNARNTLDVDFRNTPLEAVLNEVLREYDFTYEVVSKTVVLKRKVQPFLNSTADMPVGLFNFLGQNQLVKGTVTNSQAEVLPWVSIRLKNGTARTSTDKNGNFSISVPGPESVLVFSYIGFQEREAVVGTSALLKISLKENIVGLDEVLVVGYGTVTKRDVTGSIGSVSVVDLQKAPVRSFDEALAGRVAGVQVTSEDGQPGSAVNIVVRGNNSITQDNSPLYIIDGFPLEDPNNNAINPAEIESIEVLKDASSTAIYGARAANGVIIITTKRGQVGEPVLSYNGYYGVQQNIREMELMNPYEFVKYQLERDGTASRASYLSDGKTVEDYRNIQGVNWQDELFQVRPMQNHYLSIRGGTKATRYSLSGSTTNQEGIIVNSNYNRYQGRIVLDQSVNDRLKVGVNTNFSLLVRNGTSPSDGSSSQTGLMFSAWGYRPVTGNSSVNLEEDEVDEDLDLVNDSRFNPLFSAQNELRRLTTNALTVNGYAEYAFGKYFKLKVTGGVDRLSSRNDIFNNTKTRSGSPFTQSGKINGVNGSILSTERNAYLNENILSFNRNFQKIHRVDAILGATVQGSRVKTNGSSAQNLPNEALGLAGLDEGIPNLIRSTSSLFTLASFLGRVNYSYKSKYLLTASFRADGSSKFRTGNKWSYFPSAALGWSLGEEKWIKDLNVFSNAKLRVSHGITGNNRVSDFAYLSSIIMPAGVAYSFNNQLVNAAIPSELGNPDLKWETTRQTDLGLDIGFFKQRLSLEIDAYRKTTFDLLLNAKLPTIMGYGSSLKNIGKVQNQGLEFTVNSVNLDKKNSLTWNTSFNISFNRNKVLELAENQEALGSFLNWDGNYRNLPLYIARVGEPIAMFYGYIWEGNYQYTDFNGSSSGVYTLKNTVADNGSGRDQVKPGDIKYRDINGDLTINAQDQVVIGDPNPDFIGGITNNFGYKGFDLNVFFQFSVGSDVYNANRLIFEGSGRPQQNMFATYIDRWTPENQNNTYYRSGGFGPHSYSSRVVEDGSFIRLKTVQLGYNFPKELTSKIRLKNIRAYVSGQNLYTWSKYQGFDPEVSSRNSALTPAFDYSVYPRARTVTFGLNVTL